MKKPYYFILISICISFSVLGQNSTYPIIQQKPERDRKEFKQHLDITAGYAPKSPYHAGKLTFSFNNLLIKKVGAYTSFEKGLDSAYFTHIIGLSYSVHPQIYIWTGMDWFTSRGVFHTSIKGCRKEMGIGFEPIKMMAVQIGYSEAIGLTITAGYKIPF